MAEDEDSAPLITKYTVEYVKFHSLTILATCLTEIYLNFICTSFIFLHVAMFTYSIAFVYCVICFCNLNVMYVICILNVPVTYSYTKSSTNVVLNARIYSDISEYLLSQCESFLYSMYKKLLLKLCLHSFEAMPSANDDCFRIALPLRPAPNRGLISDSFKSIVFFLIFSFSLD
jgi:hypothetical protein